MLVPAIFRLQIQTLAGVLRLYATRLQSGMVLYDSDCNFTYEISVLNGTIKGWRGSAFVRKSSLRTSPQRRLSLACTNPSRVLIAELKVLIGGFE